MSDDKKVSVEDIPKFIERLIDYEGVDEYVSLCFKKENERLNNIINELEKYIDEDDWTSVNGEIAVRLIKLKLQELKELKEIK